MGNQQATESDIGWLAGIIDGEGHIGISFQSRRRRKSVRCDLQIVNTDAALIEKVVRILRAIGVNPYLRNRTHIKSTWATNTIVSVGKMAQIKRVLDQVLSHLTGTKQKRAALMLALIESRMTKTQWIDYDDYEMSLVEQFRMRFVRPKGASTTAREAPTR